MHHVMPMTMVIVLYDQKVIFAPNFDFLDGENVVVPLTMLMTLYNVNIRPMT